VSVDSSYRPTLPAVYAHADEDLPYAANADELRPGHRLALLVDGDATFPAMLDAIGVAKRYIHLETYILASDGIGDMFARALAERARAGVDVRVMYDSLGSLELELAFVRRLRDAGIRTVEYGPIGRWRNRRFWTRRDHRKILVVDGRIGFVGGINIVRDNAPRDMGGAGWRDTHMRIEGPAVGELEHLFREVWIEEGGDGYAPLPDDSEESVASADTELCRTLAADLRGRRSAIRRHYLHAIARAKHHVYIANAYFVPDRAIQRALAGAAARKVDVRVIVSLDSDIRLVQWAGEHTYAGLLASGVRLFGWRDSHMHAKVACVDGVWSTVGSYNLDYVSLFHNLEVVAEVIGRGFGARVDAMFADDFARCTEITDADWRARPWWRELLSWLAYRIRRWL
jgi:cardiolipin synthase